MPSEETPGRRNGAGQAVGQVAVLALVALALMVLCCCVGTGAVLMTARFGSVAFELPSTPIRDSVDEPSSGQDSARAEDLHYFGRDVAGEDSESVSGPAEGSLRLPGGDPSTLDPALVGDVTSAEYIYEIYSGLVTLSPELEVVPDLAKSWVISSDGTVYTFDLHDDATFHDGTSVTAESIAYAIERACDPRTGSSVAATYLGDIVGCVDKLAGRSDSVSGVQAIGDHRLALTIDAPKAHFLAKLTYPTSFALDRAQVENDSAWSHRPNGTGPFRLAHYEPGDELRLLRHDGYYRSPAMVEEVVFDLRPIDPLTRYENGELDATPLMSSDMERARDPLNPLSAELVDGAGDLSISYVGFNVGMPPFDDEHVRRAFNLALDKERLATVVLSGAVRPAHTILPPDMPGHDPALVPYPFDRTAARAELAKSSYGSAEAVPPITLDVPGEGGAPVAEAVADYLSDTLGVDVSVEQTPWDVYQSELDAREYDMFMLGWSADYPDPQDFLDLLFHSASPLNHTGYGNDDVDALLNEARVEADEKTRLALYNEAERLILSDAPWIPVYTGENTWLVAPYVHGFGLPAIVQPRLAQVRIDPQ